MFSTHQKGEIAHLHVQLLATKKGFVVSRPTTEARYDLIIDTGTRLERVQVKYADHWQNGALQVNLLRQTRNNGVKKTYSMEEVDAVYVYVPAKNYIVRLEPALFHNRQLISIRFTPSRNGQKKRTLSVEELEKWDLAL